MVIFPSIKTVDWGASKSVGETVDDFEIDYEIKKCDRYLRSVEEKKLYAAFQHKK